jgi:hypothetical protein
MRANLDAYGFDESSISRKARDVDASLLARHVEIFGYIGEPFGDSTEGGEVPK